MIAFILDLLYKGKSEFATKLVLFYKNTEAE